VSSPLYTIKPIVTRKDLLEYSKQWDSLLLLSDNNNIFLTFDWILTWIDIYIDSRISFIYILAVYEDGHLIGLAPFYIIKNFFLRVLEINTLRFIGDNEVCSDYLNFIIKRKKEYEVINTIFDYLFKNKSWHVATLENILPDSISYDHTINYFKNKGRVYDIKYGGICPYIDLPSNIQSILDSLSSNTRYQIKKKVKNTQNKINFMDYKEYHEELIPVFEEFIKLHQDRAFSKGLNGSFYSNKFTSFHTQIVKKFHENNWLKLNFFYNGEKLVAGFYGYHYFKKYYYYLLGLDPSYFKEHSLGVLLLYENINLSISDECSTFDFLRGNEKYKLSWATNINYMFNLNFYSKGLKGMLYYLFTATKNLLKLLIR
jgi:CelD/BcsL family acetyltransferase involved in cellulose biosynthesis